MAITIFGPIRVTRYCERPASPTDVIDEITIPTTEPVETIGAVVAFLQRPRPGTRLVALGVATFGPIGLDRNSPDYGTVRRGTETFTFTPTQRACLKYLIEAWEKGRREFTNRELLEVAGSTADYIRDVFRSNGKPVPAWNHLITEVEGKRGSYTLRLASG